MAAFLAIIILICLVGFVVGLISPQLTVFWGEQSRKGAFLYLLVIVVAIGVGAAFLPPGDSSAALVPYTIVDVSSKRDIKRVITVELQERATREELEALALSIKASNPGFKRTFILYSIAGESPETTWATTHFTPDLEIVIHGGTKEGYEKLKNSKATIAESDIIGCWMCNWGMDYVMTAYKKDGKVYINSRFSDGSSGDEVYTMSGGKDGTRLEKPNDFGEYFIINPQGDLEFWSKNGNFYTAPKRQP